MNKLKGIITALKESRGFSPFRVVLTIIYTFSVFYGALIFTLSIGNYVLQGIALLMFGGGLWLGLKSFKKMFDRKMREKISKITSSFRRTCSAVTTFSACACRARA